MKKLFVALILLASILSLSVIATNWPSVQNDPLNSGYTVDSGPTTNNVLWSATVTATRPLFQPIIVGSTLYVASMNDTLFAYDATTGVLLTQSPDLNDLNTGLSIPAYDGSFIYVAAQNGTVFKLNPTTLAIVAQSPDLTATPGSVTFDAVNSLIHVSVSGAADVAYGLATADLTITWQLAVAPFIMGPHAIATTTATFVYWAMNTGSIWCNTAATGLGPGWGTADLNGAGLMLLSPRPYGAFVYTAEDTNNLLYQININNAAIVDSVGFGAVTPVSIAVDGTNVYLGLDNGTVNAYDITNIGGGTIWQSPTLNVGDVYVSVSNNYVYAFSITTVIPLNGNLTALNPANGAVGWNSETPFVGNGTGGSPPTIATISGTGNLLFIATTDGYLHAFRDAAVVAVAEDPGIGLGAIATGNVYTSQMVAHNLESGINTFSFQNAGELGFTKISMDIKSAGAETKIFADIVDVSDAPGKFYKAADISVSGATIAVTKLFFEVDPVFVSEHGIYNIRLAHKNAKNEWELLTTKHMSDNEFYATTTAFSTFAIIALEESVTEETPTETQEETIPFPEFPMWIWYVAIAAVALALIALILYLFS